MNPFEELFSKAELHGLIEQNFVSDKLNDTQKRQSLKIMRHCDLQSYSLQFSSWLQEVKNYSFNDQFEYLKFCEGENTFKLFVEFIDYYKVEKKKNISENTQKTAKIAGYGKTQVVAMEILGLWEGENNWNPVKPVFYYIPEVLDKHKLSPKKAIFYLNTYTGGLNPIIDKNLKPKVIEYLKSLIDIDYELPHQQTETKTEQETIELKPVLKPEAVQIVFDILKDFFSPEHQTELKKIIETGNNPSSKLHFKANGNRLTDTFKKLIEHNFITGCRKQDLINWIISNFTFTQQNKVKPFIYDTVEKTISRNYYPCKSPLIEIKNGQIQKDEQPRKRKQSKY
jgi:hypothetical protein